MRIRLVASDDKEAWMRMRADLWPRTPMAEHAEEADFYLTGQSRGSRWSRERSQS